MAITIEVHERSRIATAAPGIRQSLLDGHIREIAFPIVFEEITGMTVVGVVERRGHLPELIGNFVLAEKHIQMTIAIDVTAGEHLYVAQTAGCFPHHPAALLEVSCFRSRKQQQPFTCRAEKIRLAIAIDVRDDAAKDRTRKSRANSRSVK